MQKASPFAGGHAVVIGGGGGGVNLRLMEERMSRLEETVNSDPGLAERLRTMEARISQLQVRITEGEIHAVTIHKGQCSGDLRLDCPNIFAKI